MYITHDGYVRPCCFIQIKPIEKEFLLVGIDKTNIAMIQSVRKTHQNDTDYKNFSRHLDNNNAL